MAEAQPGVPQSDASTEQKIDDAVAQASSIVAKFSPVAGELCAAGAAVEPVISALVHMFIGLFRHHMKQAQQKPAQQPAQQPAPAQPGQ